MSVKQELSDEQLLELLQNKSSIEKGFRLLMLKYQERLYWQIRKIVNEHDDTNDVLQNCFVKFYRNIGRFERRSKLYTWLYRIAVNESITFINKKNKHNASSIDNEDLQLANTLQADSYMDGSAVQLRLKQALTKLPSKQKIVFQLRYFEEKSYQEMAEQLETSVGALKASYHHAVKKIENYLSEVEI